MTDKTLRAASGPYPVEAKASSPSTGTPVQNESSSFLDSDVATGRPNMRLLIDMPSC